MSNQSKASSRRLIILLSLALLVASVWVGPTLAAFVRQAKLFDGGWLGPKYYAFEVESSAQTQSIAPGESASYPFRVKNHNAGGAAQVPLNVLIQVSYPPTLAGTGRLKADLYHGGQLLHTSTGGTLECAGMSMIANVNVTNDYTLSLTWQDADLTALGAIANETLPADAISIRVSGYQ